MSGISDKRGVQQLVFALHHIGLKHVVISPGSRNAPLTISFAQHPEFNTYTIPDERSAAFYALGMAEELQEPVAVVCTSGSALLNYAPAVAEAFYRSIPLVIISADRPLEWIDHGDGQTIRQTGALSNHIMAEIALHEAPLTPEQESENTSNIHQLVPYLCGNWRGPVHINFPFNEPLYNSIDIHLASPIPAISFPPPTNGSLSEADLNHVRETWLSKKKIMIICGQLPYSAKLQHSLHELASYGEIAVLIENTSNLSGRHFIQCIDRTLNSITEEYTVSFQPDLLITIGGAVISKRIKAFLRNTEDLEHWNIGYEFPEMDTYRHLSRSFELSPETFIKLLPLPKMDAHKSRFGEQWKQLDYLIQQRQELFFQTDSFHDIHVFNYLMDVIPDDSKLHMANSSVVRYCQLFDPISSIRYTCNRGTSGIDGSTSTAIGAAIANPAIIHTFISGDLSFFYDSNALWNRHLPSNVRIIVINNGGGGIFKIIPGPEKTAELEDYFVAKQSFSAEYICKAFHVHYQRATNMQELDNVMQSFYMEKSDQRPVVLEIFTDGDYNHHALNDYFKAVRVEPKILSPE
jgi:2-succinyl-5-enolpyruvyl-6-hydroxy-3-cyclohexene-1-carboxylate synthase